MKNLHNVLSYISESQTTTNLDYLQEYYDDLVVIDEAISKIITASQNLKDSKIEELCDVHIKPTLSSEYDIEKYQEGIAAIDKIINTCILYQNNRKELENNIVSGYTKDEHTIDWIDSGHTEKEKQIELSKSELRKTMQFLINNAASMAIPKAVVTDQEQIRKVNREYRKSILGSTLTGKYLEWAKQYLDL